MKDPEIYCPKCKWAPDGHALWECLQICGHQWNTFATGGMCPKCGEVFEHTQCLFCGRFSPHKDWYHDPEGSESDLEREAELDAPTRI